MMKHALGLSPRAGATVFAIVVVMSAVCMGLGAVILTYGQSFGNQGAFERQEVAATVNARSGVDNVYARINSGVIDVANLVDGMAGVQDLASLQDPGCSTPNSDAHVVTTIWENESSQHGEFKVKVVALDLGKVVRGVTRPWLRVDAVGYNGKHHKSYSVYLRPDGEAEGGSEGTDGGDPQSFEDHYNNEPYTLLHNGQTITRTLKQIAENSKSYKFDYFVFDGVVSTQQVKNYKVDICHYPPGNQANAHEQSVSLNAVGTHVGHHNDTVGACGPVGGTDDGEPGEEPVLTYTRAGPLFDPLLRIPCPAETAAP